MTTVSQDMFTVLHGQPAPVVTRWTYSAADPFAVTLGVRTRSDRFVEWLVARDLVIESLRGPVGCTSVTWLDSAALAAAVRTGFGSTISSST